jgi:hypothetical protein
MSAPKSIDIGFPIGGLNRSAAYRQPPPFTTPDALNMRPRSALEGRMIGGTRPGLVQAYPDLGGPIQMLNQVTGFNTTDLFVWEHLFVNGFAPTWQAGMGTGDPPLPSLTDDPYAISEWNEQVAAYCTTQQVDPENNYSLELFVEPYDGLIRGEYVIYASIHNTQKTITWGGFAIHLWKVSDTQMAGKIVRVAAEGASEDEVAIDAFLPIMDQPARISCVFSGDYGGSVTISVFFNEDKVAEEDFDHILGTTYQSFGFGMQALELDDVCLVTKFRLQQYVEGSVEVSRPALVAVSSGYLWRDFGDGTMAVWPDDDPTMVQPAMTASNIIESAERIGKLYIADCDVLYEGDGEIVEYGDPGAEYYALETEDYEDTTIPAPTSPWMVVISDPLGAAEAGSYAVEDGTPTADSIVLDGYSGGEGNCRFRVVRAPKIYDPVADTLIRWMATDGLGQVPANCHLICTYRDRLVLAGDPAHVWYMSRQGDPHDWDYGADAGDAGRAVAGVSSEAGKVAHEITALCPFMDDYLIIACRDSMWVMRGDPAYGGQIDNISNTVGIIGRRAWTYGEQGQLIFLSRSGICVIPPSATPEVAHLSQPKIPRELINVDYKRNIVNLEWDDKNRGVHIFVTPAERNEVIYHYKP